MNICSFTNYFVLSPYSSDLVLFFWHIPASLLPVYILLIVLAAWTFYYLIIIYSIHVGKFTAVWWCCINTISIFYLCINDSNYRGRWSIHFSMSFLLPLIEIFPLTCAVLKQKEGCVLRVTPKEEVFTVGLNFRLILMWT